MYNNIMMNFKERKSDNNNPNQSSLQKEDAEEIHDDGANKEFSCNTWPEKSGRRSEEERVRFPPSSGLRVLSPHTTQNMEPKSAIKKKIRVES